jgi:uncharacterized protein (TIGR03067 family)
MMNSRPRVHRVLIAVAMMGLIPSLFVAAQDPGGNSDTPSPVVSGGPPTAVVDEQLSDLRRRRRELAESERILQDVANGLLTRARSAGPKSLADDGNKSSHQGGVDALRNDPSTVKLRKAVASAFAARQEILRAELRDLQQRTQNLQQAIDARDRIADQIIDRRVEDLLNPEWGWETRLEARKGPNAVFNASKTLADRYHSLQGTWLAKEQGRNGVIRPDKSNTTLTFNLTRYDFRDGAGESYSSGTFAFRMDPRFPANPWLYMTRTYLRAAGSAPGMGNEPGPGKPTEPQVERAAVAIDGDTLRICSTGHRGDDNPDDFTTKPDDERLLMVYQRVSNHPMTDEEWKASNPGNPPQPGSVSALPGLPPMDVPGGARPLTDEERIQGTWKVVSQSLDGKKNMQNPPSLTMTFRGYETFTSTSNKPCLFRIDSTQTPSHLTVAGHNMYMQMIYKIDKNTMTIAFFGKPETQRPRSFTAGGDGLPLIVWELRRADAK